LRARKELSDVDSNIPGALKKYDAASAKLDKAEAAFQAALQAALQSKQREKR
jgi:hypothetical protein